MCCLLNRAPNGLDVLEPTVGGSLVANAPPDMFLWVQAWLITGQIDEVNSRMSLKKQFNLFAFVPAGPIDIHPDGVAPEATAQRLEAREEAISIAPRRARQSCSSQQRSNPAEEIQSFMMVAGRRHFQPPSTFGPPHAQPRMKGEPCLVLKHNRFTRPQIPEFFLMHAEIAGPLPNGLVNKNTPPVLSGIPVDASIAGPAGRSVLRQTADSNVAPMSVHPTGPDSNQTPTGSSPNRPPPACESDLSAAPDVPAGSWASKPQDRARLSGESTHSGSGDLYPVPRRSTQDAAPPPITEARQSLRPHALHEFLAPSMPAPLGTPPDELTQRLVFSCHQITVASA